MLLYFEGDLDAPMIGDSVVVLRAHDDLPNFHVPSEHLVEMATKAVSLCPLLQCRFEVHWLQLLDDEVHVVVEVTTDDDQSIGVLTHDISYDIGDSFSSLTQVLLLPWLKVAVEHLYIGAGHLHLCPTQVSPKCLHQLHAGVEP